MDWLLPWLTVLPLWLGFFFVNCPCCGEVECAVCQAGTVSLTYQVDVSGIVDETCLTCDDFNGTYLLPQTSVAPTACVWNMELSPSCDIGGVTVVNIQLVINEQGIVNAQVFVSFDKSDVSAAGSWTYIELGGAGTLDCSDLDSLTLASFGDDSRCDWAAGTVTVTSA